jgi:hypothetical protein
MHIPLAGVAALVVVAWSSQAMSQGSPWSPANPSADQAALPQAFIPPVGARTGDEADVSAVTPALIEGLAVRDRNGQNVGRITRLMRTDDGRQVVTILMGDLTLTVPADELLIRDGRAEIDATRAELLDRMAGGS